MKSFRLAAWFVVTVALATALRAADKELTLLAWAEYLPEPVLTGFTKETGIKVVYVAYSSTDDALAKVRTQGDAYDVVQSSDAVAEALIKEKRLLALDYKRLPNFKNILPEFTRLPHDPEQAFTVPYLVSTTGIVVNTQKVTTPVVGYKDVFVDAFKGRVGLIDDDRELVTAALATTGAGPNQITAETLAKARPVLVRWLKLAKILDADSPRTAFLDDDVDIGLVGSGEAAILWNENKKFAYILPSEGAHRLVDLLAISKSSKNAESAYKFIDYILRPEVSRQISDEFPYTNPNGEARKLLTPEQRANPASYPDTTRKLESLRDLGAAGALLEPFVSELKKAK